MKAVLFDLDGVITDTAIYHYQAWKEMASILGIDIDEEFNEHLKGVSRMDSLQLILEKGGIGNRYSESEKVKMADDKNIVYKQMIEKVSPNDLLPGIKELLKDLKDKGVLLGLASASQNGPVILDRLEVTRYFDTIVNPAALRAGKPDPEIFVKGAQQLGVDPKDCVGVEDAAAGVQAINGAGMVSVAIGNQTTLAAANKVVPATEDVSADLLEKVWSGAINCNGVF
ncbi:beta-phosphoglucomutase [Peribacillus psychrosaccharolyticus]|uniref:beta-phosphoglucomutase n=1 Tax=Peribacillus psychrosaccharolyticus TaxID=1407 RepID=UPI003D2BA418